MPKTDILKLVFHHDQRLDDLAPLPNMEQGNPLAMFTQPDPTFSTLYFSGTDLQVNTFGFNVLEAYGRLLNTFEIILRDMKVFPVYKSGESLEVMIDQMEKESFIIFGNKVDSSDTGMTNEKLREYLEQGLIVLFKKEAQNGFDLQFFSKKNIYTNFFYPLQALLPDAFRFFSMNGKRISSEQKFFFETWSLNRPPHGTEEVHPESVL